MADELTRVRDVLADRSCAVVSFDVFDTVLWRRVPRPTDLFAVLGHALREDGRAPSWVTDATFRHMRISAEQKARQAEFGPEVSLRDIWRAMPLEVFSASLEDLVRAEVETEHRYLVADLAIAELIGLAGSNDIPIALVSDTYFSEDQLRYLLDRPGLEPLKQARIFRSLEYGLDKASGLWESVLDSLGVQPEQVVHVGDNKLADLTVPGELGIRCAHYERVDDELADALDRERQPTALYGPVDPLLDPVHGDYGVTSLRAKVIRQAPSSAGSNVRTAWRYGSAVVGPALTGFAEWVVERAEQAGTRVLWCPMREGEMLSALLNNAAAARGAKVSARPIWLSRHVTSIAMIGEVDATGLRELAGRSHLLTVGQLLQMLRIRPGDVPALAGQLHTVLADKALVDRVVTALTESPVVVNQITQAVTGARERLLTSLRKAGALDEPDLTLVDLGWGATIQLQLAKVLTLAQLPQRPAGYYLATEDRAAKVYAAGLRAEGYLAQGGAPRDVARALVRSPEVLEQSVNALCGSLVDFTEDGEPILGEETQDGTQHAERRAVQDGALAFQALWHRYVEAETQWPSLAEPAAAARLANILVSALRAPTAAEAAVFGGWRHEDNFGSDVVTNIIPQDLVAAIPYLSPNDLDDLDMRDAFWPRLLAATDPGLGAQVHALHKGDLDRAALEPVGDAFETRTLWRDAGGREHEGPRRKVRINHNGLSFCRINLSGEHIREVALGIPGRPALVRIDWIEARVVGRASGPTVLRWETPQDIAGLAMFQCRWLGGTLLEFDWPHSTITLPLAASAGGPVASAQVSVAFAMMPRSATGLEPHVPSAPGVIRLAHRAAVEYQRGGPAGLVSGVRRSVTRKVVGAAGAARSKAGAERSGEQEPQSRRARTRHDRRPDDDDRNS